VGKKKHLVSLRKDRVVPWLSIVMENILLRRAPSAPVSPAAIRELALDVRDDLQNQSPVLLTPEEHALFRELDAESLWFDGGNLTGTSGIDLIDNFEFCVIDRCAFDPWFRSAVTRVIEREWPDEELSDRNPTIRRLRF
jgi:hypothetical protein